MNDLFASVLLGAGLALGLWLGVQAWLRRPVNAPQIVAALVLEFALLVNGVIALIDVIGGRALAEPVTFFAYIGGVLLPLPMGIYLARIERTRWGSIALCFTAVVVGVMMLRVMQLWNQPVGVL